MAAKAKATKIDGIEVVSAVERAVVQPGDLLVVKCDERITAQFRIYLQKQIRAAYPENKVIVLDGGLDLQVLTDGCDPAEEVKD